MTLLLPAQSKKVNGIVLWLDKVLVHGHRCGQVVYFKDASPVVLLHQALFAASENGHGFQQQCQRGDEENGALALTKGSPL